MVLKIMDKEKDNPLLSAWDIKEKCRKCRVKLWTDGKKVFCKTCGEEWVIN